MTNKKEKAQWIRSNYETLNKKLDESGFVQKCARLLWWGYRANLSLKKWQVTTECNQFFHYENKSHISKGLRAASCNGHEHSATWKAIGDISHAWRSVLAESVCMWHLKTATKELREKFWAKHSQAEQSPF